MLVGLMIEVSPCSKTRRLSSLVDCDAPSVRALSVFSLERRESFAKLLESPLRLRESALPARLSVIFASTMLSLLPEASMMSSEEFVLAPKIEEILFVVP